jgi:drug/metabolite transporter (DMT)-like permease
LLIALGIGLAVVQWAYFFAIHRLDIGIALLIQYIAPILVALWARFVFHEPVRRRIWTALALSLAGLTLIVEIWPAESQRSAWPCVLAAISYAVRPDRLRGVRRRDPISLSAWGFLRDDLWSLLACGGTSPAAVSTTMSRCSNLVVPRALWLLMLWMVVLGGILPFALIVSALRHISATRAGITAMLEPVVAIIVAWAWLGESLRPVQLSGAALTLLGIGLAQTAR